ncbi:alpha/beta hydrolase [Aspergillus undulatus]|uniref:alpha/beta hydrolase n=1 Tax=Aspergillus undulatus TaxID=1810928 RepID=UPI003CCD23EA
MPYPEPHIITPLSPSNHAHTCILLHGRGSNGPESAEEVFFSQTSHGKNPPAALSTWRWVFPTARLRWSETFEDLTAWFDLPSLVYPDEGRETQLEGLGESVRFVRGVLKKEVAILGGGERVILGGMSQEMATGLWTLFSLGASEDGLGERMGGFLGTCGWLLFAGDIEGLRVGDRGDGNGRAKAALEFFSKEIWPGSELGKTDDVDTVVLSVPVLLMHGADDAFVSIELARQARRALEETMGMPVQWLEFTGAENDGHSVKEPEGFDRILRSFEERSSI